MEGFAGSLADFPRPSALDDEDVLEWVENEKPILNYRALGSRLAQKGDLYRIPSYGGGLLMISITETILSRAIVTPADLASAITDRLRVTVFKGGKDSGSLIPQADLRCMLKSELFLQEFRSVDMVTRSPIYLSDFTLTKPGYNDGGRRERVFYIGKPASVAASFPKITAFLDAMSFASNADRTNTVAAALCVQLRNHWLGEKPIISVSANKSHAGKDTVIKFAGGMSRITPISYEHTDWALQKNAVQVLNLHPDTAVLSIDNARKNAREEVIASAFIERTVMDPEPTISSPGTGRPTTRKNDFLVAISTNHGQLSTDLLNRSWPIRLEAVGNIEDRRGNIGNPRYEFLPKNGEEIAAELRGMIGRWKDQGRPLDERVRHPFSDCAKTIGGILMVNGFTDFLGNYALRKSQDDPLRKAIGLLGSYRRGEWLAPAEWVNLAATAGLIKAIIPAADRDSERGRERGIGVVLSAHRGEKFPVMTDDERMTLRLEKTRRRFDGGEPSVRYRSNCGKSRIAHERAITSRNRSRLLGLAEYGCWKGKNMAFPVWNAGLFCHLPLHLSPGNTQSRSN